MNCNPERDNEMMEYTDCPFCDQQLQLPSTKNDSCCENQNMINDKSLFSRCCLAVSVNGACFDLGVCMQSIRPQKGKSGCDVTDKCYEPVIQPLLGGA